MGGSTNDWRSARDPVEVQRELERVDQIQRTKVPEGVPMATWALVWCLRHPAVNGVVAGCKLIEQLEANAAAADLEVVERDT